MEPRATLLRAIPDAHIIGARIFGGNIGESKETNPAVF